MLSLYTQIGFWNIPTFRLTIGIAIVFSLIIALYHQHPRGQVVNIYLGGLVLGILGARLFHVALNWDYFTDNRAEIWVIGAGGLDWHGAVLGGMIGLALVLWMQNSVLSWAVRHHYVQTEVTRQSFNRLVASLILALPLIGLGGWVGCLAAGCGYGKEVDSLANYSRWATSELVDVFGIVAPRYNTPYFGMALCGLALIIGLVMLVLGRKSPPDALKGRRFWWLLAFMSAGMFMIGFYRADHTLVFFGLRGDQIVDVIMALWSAVVALRIRDDKRSERS